MRRYEISDEQWEKIKDKLPCQPGYPGKGADNRLFINAVLFVAKCGIPWRDLPERFGNWNSVYTRFRRWAKKGIRQKIFKAFYLESEGIEAVIPSKRSRLQKKSVDYKTYKQRNMIEQTINRLKQYRKIATRYEKTATSFLALCCFAATFINLSL